MSLLIVQKSSYTELFSSCTIPAGPVSGTAGLMTKYAVQPIAMLRTLRRISLRSAIAVNIVGIVTPANQTKSSISVVYKSVGTRLQESLALIAVIVQVAGRLVGSTLYITFAAGVLANEIGGGATSLVTSAGTKLISLDRR